VADTASEHDPPDPIPSRGDRIELVQKRMGVRLHGTVYFSDQIQVLVRWDNGRSQSLRVGIDRFRIIDPRSEG
jgi:hypothetical protein